MKIRSLLLGSIAAAGLSATGAYAADLGVATSLDVCSALGLSGLTISSDSNCLQISGGVSFEGDFGNFKGDTSLVRTGDDNTSVANNTATLNSAGTALVDTPDWYTKMITYLKFVGSAPSDFGPAKVTIQFRNEQYSKSYNGVIQQDGDDTSTWDQAGDYRNYADFDQAYVSVGDTTVLMAGKKGSIINYGDDEPFNWLSLFNSDNVDDGVKWSADVEDGGTSIQIVSDLGNGVSVGAGLEDLNDASLGSHNTASNGVDRGSDRAGTLVGVLSYAGDTISAHISGVATGVLDGTIDDYAVHAGFTGTFNNFKLRGAIAADDLGYWNGLATAAATFDIFTLAASVEAVHYGSDGFHTGQSGIETQTGALSGAQGFGGGGWDPAKNNTTDWGAGASLSAAIASGVTLNVGGRYYHEAASSPSGTLVGAYAVTPGNSAGWGGGANNAWQVAANISSALTETLTASGELGAYGSDRLNADPNTNGSVWYGSAGLAWAPGGGFTSSVTGTAYSDGAYKAVFKAAKDFQ